MGTHSVQIVGGLPRSHLRLCCQWTPLCNLENTHLQKEGNGVLPSFRFGYSNSCWTCGLLRQWRPRPTWLSHLHSCRSESLRELLFGFPRYQNSPSAFVLSQPVWATGCLIFQCPLLPPIMPQQALMNGYL